MSGLRVRARFRGAARATVHRPGAFLKLSFRRATASWRDLPDYLIIGAQKGGSTSLKKALEALPGVLALSGVGEPGYFSMNYWRGQRWYRAHFPTRFYRRRRVRQLGFVPLCGEKSPTYLNDAYAPERVRRDLPDARVVALLRHPIHRALSHYAMAVQKGLEPNSLLDAFADDWGMTPDAPATGIPGATPIGRHAPRSGFRYLRRGRYSGALERWYRCLAAEQILVIRSEDFDADPHAVLACVCSFLSLPEPASEAPRRFNVRAVKDEVQPELWQALLRYYEEPNRRLMELTGIGWDDWSVTPWRDSLPPAEAGPPSSA